MEDNGTVTLTPVGDVELWFAEPDDCSWRLPLHVEWKQDPAGVRYGLILPALCFYEIQLVVMRAQLQGHSLQLQTDRWLLPEVTLQALLRKAPGIHAEYYYNWPGGELPAVPSPYHSTQMRHIDKEPRKLEDYRGFATFIARQRALPADVVLMVVTAIAQLGSKWMLEMRQPLDLGFVKLIALPFRANWKEIIMFKCRPWKLERVLRSPADVRAEALQHYGFQKVACSLHNIGLKQGSSYRLRRLEYTIEALPTEKFEQAVNEAERERMRAGHTSYVAQYEEGVETLYDQIVLLLAHYSRKISASWATVREFGRGGVLAFLPVGRHSAKVHGLAISDIPAHIVPPITDFSVFAERKSGGDPHLVCAQNAEMRKVPRLPSPAPHLREGHFKRNVDKP